MKQKEFFQYHYNIFDYVRNEAIDLEVRTFNFFYVYEVVMILTVVGRFVIPSKKISIPHMEEDDDRYFFLN